MWLALCWRGVQILLFGLTLLDYLPELWQRIRLRAFKNYEEFYRRQISKTNGNVHQAKVAGPGLDRPGEDIYVQRAAEIEDAEPNPSHIAAIKGKLNSLNASQLRGRQQEELISLPAACSTEEAREYLENKESSKVSTIVGSHRRRAVAEIAKRFEENDFNSKTHKVSLAQPVSGTYFEGFRGPKETNGSNSILISNAFASNFPRPLSNYRSEDVSVPPPLEKRHLIPNCNTSQASELPAFAGSGDNASHNKESTESLSEKESSFCIIRRRLPGRVSHAPVESIEEILEQQRFSRSFSTYSISDLLKDSGIDVNADVDFEMDECLNGTNK